MRPKGNLLAFYRVVYISRSTYYGTSDLTYSQQNPPYNRISGCSGMAKSLLKSGRLDSLSFFLSTRFASSGATFLRPLFKRWSPPPSLDALCPLDLMTSCVFRRCTVSINKVLPPLEHSIHGQPSMPASIVLIPQHFIPLPGELLAKPS